MTANDPRARWDGTYARPYSPTLMRLLRSTLAPTLPEGVEATTVWPTWPLERIVAELGVGEGRTFLDAGCGRGQITTWIAKETGASLIGLDPSAVAVGQAAEHAAQHLDRARWRFVEGYFGAIPLDDATVDAVLAVDSLHFARDQRVAFAELGRVLRAGGRLVVTLPVLLTDGPPLDLLAAAGFVVTSVEETPHRVARMYAYAQALRDHEDELARELGAEQARELVAMDLEGNADKAAHYLIVADRITTSG